MILKSIIIDAFIDLTVDIWMYTILNWKLYRRKFIEEELIV